MNQKKIAPEQKKRTEQPNWSEANECIQQRLSAHECTELIQIECDYYL